MPSHPRIEEVEDSDISDPSEGDISDFDDADILRAVGPSTTKPAVAPSTTLPIRPAQQSQPQQQPPHPPPSAYAAFQALYPVYFDSTRTRAEGRRVSRALATPNPLAAEIAAACARIGLSTVFEPGKSHPKDWGNPGRVKVGLKMITTATPEQIRTHGLQKPKVDVKNKHHLYVLVAKHLRENPTTDDSAALRDGPRNMGPPPKLEDGKWPRPSLPRGVKVGELVPFYSPAMSGGGMEEDVFKDVMKGVMGNMGNMAQGGPGGMDVQQMLAAAQAGQGGAGAGAGGGAKKEKKGKGKGKA